MPSLLHTNICLEHVGADENDSGETECAYAELRGANSRLRLERREGEHLFYVESRRRRGLLALETK